MKMRNKKNENENEQSCDNLCNLVVRKRRMIKDERGQWIISAGFLVSVSIIILALLLNQAMMGGYQSSGAILEFPKHDIRELVQETHREVIIAADKAWEMTPYTDATNTTKDKDAVIANFTIANFTNQTLRIYATHGQMVYVNVSSLTCNITTHKIEKVDVTILFSDGVTTCTFEPEVIEIPIVPEQVPGPSFETLYAENLSCNGCNITNPENASNIADYFVATVSDVSDDDTVNATINDSVVGVGDILSVKFGLWLGGVGTWKNDEIKISYSPNNGSTWYIPPAPPANTFQPNVSSLTWHGSYTAVNVTTWEEVNNMTIKITGIAKNPTDPVEVDGNLSIDAYRVYVKYQAP